MHVDVPEGNHLLAFYLFDQDWRYTQHPRQQSVLLFDENGGLLNGAWTGKFGAGAYERFSVHGPLKLTARFFKHRSACVALSGVFLDELAPGRPLGGRASPRAIASPAAAVNLALPDRTLLHRLRELRNAGENVEANRLLTDRLRKSKDASRTASLCIAFAGPGKDLPCRWAYLAAGRFFELEPGLSDAAARPLLRRILRNVFAHRFVPVRRRALAAWQRRGLEPDALVRHAARRLGVSLVSNRPGAPAGKSAGEKI